MLLMPAVRSSTKMCPLFPVPRQNCPGSRAIHREVLIGHQSVRALDHAAEKAPRDLLIEQSIAILVNTVVGRPSRHRRTSENSRL
jgi:hypothetical protein